MPLRRVVNRQDRTGRSWPSASANLREEHRLCEQGRETMTNRGGRNRSNWLLRYKKSIVLLLMLASMLDSENALDTWFGLY